MGSVLTLVSVRTELNCWPSSWDRPNSTDARMWGGNRDTALGQYSVGSVRQHDGNDGFCFRQAACCQGLMDHLPFQGSLHQVSPRFPWLGQLPTVTPQVISQTSVTRNSAPAP